MKTIKTFAIIAFLLFLGSASAQSVMDKWPAIHSFHEVMSRTFHPTEQGNFQPLRNESELLANLAKELPASERPEEFKTPAIADALSRLQEKTRMVNKLIMGKSSDETLKPLISEAHDIFHEIVGLCSAEKKEKH